MTRKDYVLIAAALKEARMHWLIGGIARDAASFRAGLRAAVQEVAGALARDNAKFDRERFIKACWGEE